jgi:hypothetical protein
MKGLHVVAFILLLVGGLNWLLVGLFGWDVGQLFGGMGALVSRVIYVLVGLAAVVEIFGHKSACRVCGTGRAGGERMGGQPSQQM